MKSSFTLEMKDDEDCSVWNMFNKWCSDVTKEKEKEKENKRLKKEADKIVKATKRLEKEVQMPDGSLLTVYKNKEDAAPSVVYGNFAPVVTTGVISNNGNAVTLADPFKQLKIQTIFPSSVLGAILDASSEGINLDSYTYEELREIIFGDDNKAELTKETIEKILDKYPTFFDEQDLELADHDSDKRVSKLFKEKPMAPPSNHLYLQNIKPTKPKKRGKSCH